MTLTQQVKEQVAEALDKAEDIRDLLLACMNGPTPEKLVKGNELYTVRMAYLVKAAGFIEQLHKQNSKDLKEIVRLENDITRL